MDVGTAKPPVAERRGIEHHLVDHLDVNEPLTVAQFQRDARRVIADLRLRVVVGHVKEVEEGLQRLEVCAGRRR